MNASSTASHDVPLGATMGARVTTGAPSSRRNVASTRPLFCRTAIATAESATSGAPSIVQGAVGSAIGVDQRTSPE